MSTKTVVVQTWVANIVREQYRGARCRRAGLFASGPRLVNREGKHACEPLMCRFHVAFDTIAAILYQ